MRNTSVIFIFIGFLLSGCVTVKMANEGNGKRAEGVTYTDPAKPFEKENRPEVDAAWKNGKNGNSISYVSDCADPSDPSLDQITGGILAGLSDLKVESEGTASVQGREGKRMHALGRVDGVPSEIDLLVFKRNHCIYILTYLGVKKAFSENRQAFSSFIDGFKAP